MPNILIVDDNDDDRKLLTLLFEKNGFQVRNAPSGRDALMEVLRDTPDVVLLDLAMPEMDGPSFLEVVRSYLRIKSLPVVVYTGLNESPMIDHAQALRVNAVLAKGKATPEQIISAAQEAIARIP